jgi:hypothetical protein
MGKSTSKGNGRSKTRRAAAVLPSARATRRPLLSEALEVVERLDADSQDELIAILQRRLAERGRRRIIADVKQARREFAAGQYDSKTAPEIVREAMS